MEGDHGPSWTAKVLDLSAHQHKGRLFVTSRKTGASTWHESERISAVGYPSFQPTASGNRYYLKVYTLSGQANAMQHWWELRLLPGPLGLAHGKQSSCRWALDSWFRWVSKLSEHFPVHVLLKKAVVRQRGHAEVGRCMPEHTASTCGLLMILVERSQTARPPCLRVDAFHMLEAFLQRWLGDTSFDMYLVAELEFRPSLGCDSSAVSGMTKISVDGGDVDLKPLLSGGSSRAAVLQLSMLLDSACCKAPGIVKVPLLLKLASDRGHDWLYNQLLSELTLAITFAINEQASSFPTDPMNLQTDFDSFLEGKRLDTVVAEKLSLGEGTGQSGERVYNPSQHARSWSMFKGDTKQVNVAFSMGLRMMRYLTAGKDFLKECVHLSVALDGSRFSGLDITLAVVQGTSQDKVTKAMWAPPQVAS